LRYSVIFFNKKRYKPYKMGVIRNISVKVFEENIPDLMKKAMGHFGHLISGCPIAVFSRL